MEVPLLNRVADRIQAFLASCPLAVKACLKLRNQARCVIGKHLSEGIDRRRNGELLLAQLVAPLCRHAVDVGANVGEWTAMFREQAGSAEVRVLAYEPSDEACAVLRDRFKDVAVGVRRKALGNFPGRAIFHQEPGCGTRSSVLLYPNRLPTVEREVEVTTLDAEIESEGWSRVDFLKLDTEGFDYQVLQGARRLLSDKRIRFVQFEYETTWQYSGATLKAAFDLLGQAGYRTFLVRGKGFTEFDWDRYGEFFLYSNFLALLPDDIQLIRSHLVTLP